MGTQWGERERDALRAGARRPRLLYVPRATIRAKHYSYRTEKSYVQWVRRFILFHDKRHPREMGEAEVREFVTHLAVKRKVAASTQTQALSAILFLYREVLRRDMEWVDGVVRTKEPARLPVVLTRADVRAILNRLTGTKWLMTSLLYGAGLRLAECTCLRAKGPWIDRHQIMVRDGKGRNASRRRPSRAIRHV